MRLQVEHDLQAMLDPPQQLVILGKQHALLMGQAAGLLQSRDGLQRVAGPNRGRLAAMKQLEELNHVLDVTDPSASRLHVTRLAPFADRTLLDAPLERLDPRDVRDSGNCDKSTA